MQHFSVFVTIREMPKTQYAPAKFEKIFFETVLRYSGTYKQTDKQIMWLNGSNEMIYKNIYIAHLSHWAKFLGSNDNQCGHQLSDMITVYFTVSLQLLLQWTFSKTPIIEVDVFRAYV